MTSDDEPAQRGAPTGTWTHGTAAVEVSQPDPRRVCVSVSGDVDLSNCQQVNSTITRSLTTDVDELVVDLTNTHYIDSAGLTVLVRLAERLANARITLTTIAPAGAPPHRVITLTGLESLLGVRP